MRYRRSISRALAAVAAGAVVALMVLPREAAAQNVAVMVNGDPITTYDIDQRARLSQLVTHKPAVRQEVLDELIDEKLKVQIGKRYKFEISDAQVEQAFGDMGKRMHLSGQQLTQVLAQAGSMRRLSRRASVPTSPGSRSCAASSKRASRSATRT